MPIPRLAVLTGLAVLGALCAGTAASVYTATTPRRELHAQAGLGGAPSDPELGADPRATQLRQLAGSPVLPAAARLRLPGLVAQGACLQVREMLFGVSAERYAALDSLAPILAPLPEARAATARARASLIRFDRSTLRARVLSCRNHTG